jgi:dienelactone hydrolase
VVLLHGSGGFHSGMVSWTDRLSRWGYVALAVDSFGPRGLEGVGNVAREHRSSVKLIVYPGVYHGFDIADLGILPGRVALVQGRHLEYNEAATRDAAAQVRAFLDGAMKD